MIKGNPYTKSGGFIIPKVGSKYPLVLGPYRVGIRGGSKMRQANLVIFLNFRSADDAGFTTPNVVPKDPLVLGLRSRNLIRLWAPCPFIRLGRAALKIERLSRFDPIL